MLSKFVQQPSFWHASFSCMDMFINKFETHLYPPTLLLMAHAVAQSWFCNRAKEHATIPQQIEILGSAQVWPPTWTGREEIPYLVVPMYSNRLVVGGNLAKQTRTTPLVQTCSNNTHILLSLPICIHKPVPVLSSTRGLGYRYNFLWVSSK